MERFNPRIFKKRFIIIDENTDPPTIKMNCVACGTLVTDLYEKHMFCRSCFLKWQETNDRICDRCTSETDGQNMEAVCKKCRMNRGFMISEMLS